MNMELELKKARDTGTLWICGEMAFPIKQGAYEAYKVACDIAEQCGYLVSWQHRGSSFTICGGDIVGYVVCDWYDGAVIVKVEHWTCQTAWMQEV
jgi:hypothetical protein